MSLDNSVSIEAYSIKTRLTLFYSLTTAILLIVTTLFFYLTTLHMMHKGNQQFLSDEINVLKNLLENQPQNFLGLKQEVMDSSYIEETSEYRFYIRVLDENNNTLLQTPYFNQALSQANFFTHPQTQKDKKMIHWHSSENKFLLMQAKANLGHSQHSVLIQVALDVTYQQSIVTHYSKILILILFSIMLIAIGLGYLIANRAMRSLYRLTETTQKITVSSLHKRIDPNRWPKELKNLGTAFNDMLGRIENAVKNLSEFSGDLAHELRTPINNLMGEAEIVLSRPHTLAEYQQVLESHLEELQRLAHMIENILFLARTENPKLDIKKENINIANEINLICEFYQAMADENNLRLSVVGNAFLDVNPIMFRRMLSNLLCNSIKYTPAGGSIQFTVKEKIDAVEITLTDTGIGMAPEHLPKLFNRFYRIDSARARSAGGIGLGLPIVKSIVELHHGTITIESEVNKGTIICLTFPRGNL